MISSCEQTALRAYDDQQRVLYAASCHVVAARHATPTGLGFCRIAASTAKQTAVGPHDYRNPLRYERDVLWWGWTALNPDQRLLSSAPCRRVPAMFWRGPTKNQRLHPPHTRLRRPAGGCFLRHGCGPTPPGGRFAPESFSACGGQRLRCTQNGFFWSGQPVIGDIRSGLILVGEGGTAQTQPGLPFPGH